MSNIMVDMQTHFDVQRFLAHEARLLDGRRFEEWLGLFAEDARYWMPNRKVRTISNRPGDRDVERELADEQELYIFNETVPKLQLRINRISTARQLWCENPPSRTRHLITNVEAWETETPGELNVSSNFAVYQGRFDEKGTQFFGCRHDILRATDDSFRIAYRKIILDWTVLYTGAVTVFF